MGALAPVSDWIPEDYLLLKNAVEAGASLESLAKGAVQFSRRFTIRELQDRWYSLLYDESIASKVADQMLFLEPSAAPIFSKNNKSLTSKGKEWITHKRNVESVRSHYYSMRKRICNEPCNSDDLRYLVGPTSHDGNGNENDFQEQFVGEGTMNETCILGPISNHFGLPETGFPSADHGFASNDVAPIEGELPGEIIGEDCLYGFAEDMPSSSVDKAVGSDPVSGFGSENLQKDIPQLLHENPNAFHNCSDPQNTGHLDALAVNETFIEPDDLQPMSVSAFSSRGHNFDSPISDCVPSFHQLEFSSPSSSLAIWRTIEELSEPVIPVDSELKVEEISVPPDVDVKELATLDYGVQSEPKEKDCKISIFEKDILELSNSLLNCSSEEELFCMDIDEKDVINRSCLDGFNSILLNSPHANATKEPSVTESRLAISEGMPLEQLAGVGNCTSSACGDVLNFCASRFDENPSTSNQLSSFKSEECMFCSLNTEDPDIPDNDDIFPPAEVDPNSIEACGHGLKPDNAGDEWKTCDAALFFTAEGMPDPMENVIGSGTKRSGEEPMVHAGGHGENSDCVDVPLSAMPTHSFQEPNLGTLTSELAREKNFDTNDLQKAGGYRNSKDFVLDPVKSGSAKCYSQRSHKLEDTSQVSIPMMALSPKEIGHGESRLSETIFSASDHEELSPGSDDDVPYFSDIEAMILDMDLGPYDEESYFAREASKYQYEDTKRTIIRLEQGANSYMQRAIASHGALAVFYGRQVKYYLKKHEVLIGRATDDINVDIDLRKEGRANKVSRRQAVIKMEEDGSFYLTNLGKYPISVNGRDVANGQRSSLNSRCLIAIGGMRFMFEMNRHFDQQHISNIALRKGNRDHLANFDWTPDDNL